MTRKFRGQMLSKYLACWLSSPDATSDRSLVIILEPVTRPDEGFRLVTWKYGKCRYLEKILGKMGINPIW